VLDSGANPKTFEFAATTPALYVVGRLERFYIGTQYYDFDLQRQRCKNLQRNFNRFKNALF
jgi:hypothetical protein